MFRKFVKEFVSLLVSVVILSLILPVVNAETLTTFSDGTSSKDTTFQIAGNQIIYLSIPKNASIISANLNLQGLHSNGNYPAGVTLDVGNDNSVDWKPKHIAPLSTFSTPSGWSRPIELIGRVGTNIDYFSEINIIRNFKENFTIRSMGLYLSEVNGNPASLNQVYDLNICEVSSSQYQSSLGCISPQTTLKENLALNWTGWKQFDVNDFPVNISSYKFSLAYKSGTRPIMQNVTGSLGTYESSVSGWFNIKGFVYNLFGTGSDFGVLIAMYFNYIFDTGEITSNLSTSLNNYLSTCSPSSNGNCLVPITIHSESQGIIRASNVSVQYTVPIPVCSNNADCFDNNNSTKDICNNPGSASASCSNIPITACISNDNYCPSGCYPDNDNDCKQCLGIRIKIDNVTNTKIIYSNPSAETITSLSLITSDNRNITNVVSSLAPNGTASTSWFMGMNTSVTLRGLCQWRITVEGKCSSGQSCWLQTTQPTNATTQETTVKIPVSTQVREFELTQSEIDSFGYFALQGKVLEYSLPLENLIIKINDKIVYNEKPPAVVFDKTISKDVSGNKLSLKSKNSISFYFEKEASLKLKDIFLLITFDGQSRPILLGDYDIKYSKVSEATVDIGGGVKEVGSVLEEIDRSLGGGQRETATATESGKECDGCLLGSRCLPYGTRDVKDSNPVYCSIEKILELQKGEQEVCQNNYECLSNFCSNGNCLDVEKELKEQRGIIQMILDFFKRIFSFFGLVKELPMNTTVENATPEKATAVETIIIPNATNKSTAKNETVGSAVEKVGSTLEEIDRILG